MKKLLLLVVLIVVMSLIAAVLFAGWSFRRRALQVRTFTDMQIISTRIGRELENRPASSASLEPIVQSVNRGQDAWGNDFILETRTIEDGRLSYVLVSRGSDGLLDEDTTSAYFGAKGSDIRGEVARDLVFRDGVAVTAAGK